MGIPHLSLCARGETRTRMTLRSRDFKSLVSTISPPGHMVGLRSRPELNRSKGFCRPVRNHSATRPIFNHALENSTLPVPEYPLDSAYQKYTWRSNENTPE